MNELQEIEARLQERRAAWAASNFADRSEIPPSLCFAHLTQAEDDLDRAFIMLENEILVRQQARADVLKLREAFDIALNEGYGSWEHARFEIMTKALTDTEHYEVYR